MTRLHLTPWGIAWLVWLAQLLCLELYWLAVNARNTLSDQVWALERVDLAHPLDFAEWTWLHWLIAIVVWVLFGWLSVHLPFGWLR